jgi:hypothetical protein
MTKELPEHIKKLGEGPGLDDKSRASENIHNLSSENPMIRGIAAEYTGMLAERYGAEFVILCGGVHQLKERLFDKSPYVVQKTAIAFSQIARRGGTDALLEDGIDKILIDIMKSQSHKVAEKDAAAQAIGWIYVSKTN